MRKSGRAASQNASTEIEIKLRVADASRFLRQLARLKARLTHRRVHEMNTLYDTPDANLARRGRMLRLRVEHPAPRASGTKKPRKLARARPEISALLTFKGPAKGAPAEEQGGYKVREEHEVRISDHGGLPKILESLGLRPRFRYEKFRTTFQLLGLRGVKLMVDETPIGDFVELEGERGEIDRATELLGFARSDYITKSYGALFMEVQGVSARASSQNEPIPFAGVPDMVFPPNKTSGELSHKIRPFAAR